MRVNGFTLTELMVVMAIAVILMTVAVPGMESLYGSLRQDSAVTRLVRELNLARGHAINYGAPVSLCHLDSDSNCQPVLTEGIDIFVDSDDDGVFDSGERILSSTTAFASRETVRIGTSSGTKKRIRFRPDGLATGYNNSIYYCDNSGDYYGRVVIAYSGRIRDDSDDLTGCGL